MTKSSHRNDRLKYNSALLAGLLSTWVHADTEMLAPIVVSASKLEQTTLEAPSNVTVVTAGEIEKSTAFRLGDALTAKVPGLYIRGGALGTTSRDSAGAILSLRGAYGTRTKVLLDGVSSLADANSGGVNFSAISLGDVDRVEVVPGVSSSLYGSDAIGGVINLMTKAPSKQEFSAAYTQGFGEGDRQKYELAYRDRFSNGLALSLAFEQQDMGGFAGSDLITVTPTACGNCSTVVSGWEKTKNTTGATQYIVGDRGPIASVSKNFSSRLFYDLSPTDKLKAGYSRYEVSVEGAAPPNFYLYTAGGPLTLPATNLGLDGGRVASLRQNAGLIVSTERVENRYSLGYEGKFAGGYQLKLDWVRSDRDYFYSTASSTSTTTTYAGGPGKLTMLPNSTDDYQAQLSFPVGADHFWVLGVSLSDSELNRQGYDLSNWRDFGSKTTLTDQVDAKTRMQSFFMQDQIAVGQATTLYLGGRYDQWTTKGKIFNSLGLIPNVVVPERSFGALSPRLAVVHKLSEAWSLKSSIGEAFRAPTMFDLYAADTVSGSKLIKSDYQLKPERAKAWDVGTEMDLSNGGRFGVSYFYTRISDMIYSKESPYTGAPLGGLTPVRTVSEKTNAASGLSKGVELSASWPFFSWLTGRASYTYTDARITSDQTGTGLQGKRLVFVPKNMASLGLDARYNAWDMNWSSRYTGLQYGNALNDDVEKDVYLGTSKYWVSDMKLTYRFDKQFKGSLMVNNVFDKKYYENYVMPGRNWGFRISADF